MKLNMKLSAKKMIQNGGIPGAGAAARFFGFGRGLDAVAASTSIASSAAEPPRFCDIGDAAGPTNAVGTKRGGGIVSSSAGVAFWNPGGPTLTAGVLGAGARRLGAGTPPSSSSLFFRPPGTA